MKRAFPLCAALTIYCAAALAHATPTAAGSRDEPPGAATGREAQSQKQRLPDQARRLQRRRALDPVDVALILPRLALTVPRCALKLVFFPIQKAIELADRHPAIDRAIGTVADALPVKRETDPLSSGSKSPSGVAPQVEVDSFSGVAVGLKAFHEDLAGHAEYGSAEARIGGIYDVAAQLAFHAARFGGSRLWLESLVRYESEPALLFNGLGPREDGASGSELDPRRSAVPTRYRQERTLSLLRSGYSAGEHGRLLQLGATALYAIRSTGPSDEPPSVEKVYDTRQLAGFGERVATLEADLNATLNTLEPPILANSGVYIDVFAGRVPKLSNYGYWHQGVDATFFVNLYHGDRVLIVRALVESVTGNAGEIPFADLPSLGGPHRLRGYALDRFRDEKAALGSVDYHYPIHQYVAGAIFVEAGRTCRSFEECFDDGWHPSFGAGFFIRSRDKQLFSFHVASGDALRFYLTTDPWRVFSKRETDL